MLIGQVFEKTPSVTASENMANRLADKVRNLWLDETDMGRGHYEANFAEDPDGIAFLREESFPDLVGVDYIFRWWGGKELDDLAGDLEVLWKVKSASDNMVELYKTTIRFANRDFVMGTLRTEDAKREANRKEFRKAFDEWRTLYLAAVQK